MPIRQSRSASPCYHSPLWNEIESMPSRSTENYRRFDCHEEREKRACHGAASCWREANDFGRSLLVRIPGLCVFGRPGNLAVRPADLPLEQILGGRPLRSGNDRAASVPGGTGPSDRRPACARGVLPSSARGPCGSGPIAIQAARGNSPRSNGHHRRSARFFPAACSSGKQPRSAAAPPDGGASSGPHGRRRFHQRRGRHPPGAGTPGAASAHRNVWC